MIKIYIAGKISGECETPELMEKCKRKFYDYSNYKGNPEKDYESSTMFYIYNDIWWTHGLFINRAILGKRIWSEYMRNDLEMLLHCDEIHMLPDWKDSKGAKIEHQLALDLGIKVVYVTLK